MSLSKRPPIVAVLGHVDHGKTTLLDTIRHTSIQLSETGGITQHIGAYQIDYQGSPITFIDTPGHAAFTTMRSRGGQTADLGILVVAADDGVMPQTRESIGIFEAAQTPFLVAINKVDLPNSDPQKIKGQLAEVGVLVEGFGGNVPVVEISAKKGTNLDKLLETLLLMAEMEELDADPNGHLEALIIESSLDKNKGAICTMIIKNGTLKVGDKIVALGLPGKPAESAGRIKSLVTWPNKEISEALPSMPVQVLGFDAVPAVGSVVTRVGQEKEVTGSAITTRTPLIKSEEVKHLQIILKTDTVGTLEATEKILPPEVEVLFAETGPINESDVLLIAGVANSKIIGFRSVPTPSAKKLAKVEKVDIETFMSIYDLVDKLKEELSAAALARVHEVITGSAIVLKIFDINGVKIVGAKVDSGSLLAGDRVHLKRGDRILGDAQVTSLRIGRETRDKIKKGEEFGATFDTELDYSAGDSIIAFKIIES